MRQIVKIAGLLVAAVVLWWFFPPFHFKSLQTGPGEQEPDRQSAGEFAVHFWETRLAEALPTAADAATVLAAVRQNPQQAREQFGRSIGLSRVHYFFVRGNGRIVSVDRKTVGVALDDGDADADLLIPRGLVFGNAVRDATGLLNPSDYPDSQFFNEIASELNRIVERRVLPLLDKQAAAGRTLQLVGCGEIENRADGAVQLRTIPLEVQFD